jgi:uncharacterized RDD family membrane protein YckC
MENVTEKYVREVLHHVHAPAHERARIETDLRAHLQDALEGRPAGESMLAVIARMGSPEEVAAAFMAGLRLEYAGFWRRLVAFAVDLAVEFAIVSPLVVVGVVLSNLVPERDPQGAEALLGGLLILLIVGIALAVAGILLFYFPLLEGRFGQTPGKRLLGLRVVKESGTAIGYKEAFMRRLSFYFEFVALDALFIPFTDKRQRAMDIVAKTVVIRDPV